jgi:diaminopimelate epimerase
MELINMKFTKMEGLANDFIVTHDTLGGDAALLSTIRDKSVALCDRRRGIGADGVLCVLPSANADYMMRVFNADGSEAEMCGNGIRCFAKYITSKGLSDNNNLAIETMRGLIRTSRIGDDIRVDMGPPILSAPLIPTIKSSGRVIMEKLTVDGADVPVTAVSMGNPHAVVYVNELTDDLVLGMGKKLESHPFFPKHTNVEFITVLSGSEIRMRVYERGCGETMACGTGACASVVSGILNSKHGNNVVVHLLGGDLRIEWDGNESHSVFMTGGASMVYDGEIAL